MSENMTKEIVVELYRGDNQDAEGVELHNWDGELDADTYTWLEEQGWGTDDPDLWVLIRDADPAPNNNPIASRVVTIQS